MGKIPTIEINAAQRILRLKGALSGIVFTGTDKVRSGYGNGDCLYFDFYHRVFAVADGTERFPWASRDILRRLSDTLIETGVPTSADNWKELINQRIYSKQKYQHKTTFSCVAVNRAEEGINITIAHGGDSVVMIVNSLSGHILFQTDRNMVFAGRSKEIIDVNQYHVHDRNIRVVIYSDGFEDLFRYCLRQSFFSCFSDVFSKIPADHICEKMYRVLMENTGLFEHDDVAFIVFDPFRVHGFENQRVLIGGTQPHEEKYFRSEQGSKDSDFWIPHKLWKNSETKFREIGITISENIITERNPAIK